LRAKWRAWDATLTLRDEAERPVWATLKYPESRPDFENQQSSEPYAERMFPKLLPATLIGNFVDCSADRVFSALWKRLAYD
jgi:hypothetical protein